MKFFTFVLQYKSYTSISQIRAADVRAALNRWCDKFAKDKSPDLPPYRRQLAEELGEDPPIPISDAKNVWCATASVRGNLALLNIIQTDG